MEERELRQQITETGRRLLQDGLVARTWGNVSARVDAEHFLITPSGLDYMQTKDEDLVPISLPVRRGFMRQPMNYFRR